MKQRTPILVIVAAAALAACGEEGPLNDDRAIEAVDGIPELGQRITALGTPPTFNSTTFALSVTMADNEVAVIEKHPVTGAILVNSVSSSQNGVLCTSLNIKTIAIDASAQATAGTIILDFTNGIFAPGTATAAGITVTNTTNTAYKMRGTSVGDTVTLGVKGGVHKIAFNTDAFPDVTFSAIPSSFTFALGGGNDVFAANTTNAVTYLGSGATAATSAATVYGGLGDDTFTGGAGSDVFSGDEGNDTYKASAAAVVGGKTFHGGAGTDTADYSARPASESLTLQPDAAGVATSGNLTASEADILYDDVENLIGGAGNDTFIPNSTEGHQFTGGAGNDLVDYSGIAAAITVTMADKIANDGPTRAGGKPADNIMDDVENVKCAAANICTVTGNALDNVFIMPASVSVAHVLNGLAGVDTVDFTLQGGALNVKMDNTASTTGGLKINTDIENIKCPTGANACTVLGNDLANHILLQGSALNTISTGNGDDWIDGALGADVIDCGSGSDIVTGAPNTTGTRTTCEL